MVYSPTCLFVLGSLLLSPAEPSSLLPTKNEQRPNEIERNVRRLGWLSDLLAKVSKENSSQPQPTAKPTRKRTPKPTLEPTKPLAGPTTNHPSPSKPPQATQAPTNLPTKLQTKSPSTSLASQKTLPTLNIVFNSKLTLLSHRLSAFFQTTECPTNEQMVSVYFIMSKQPNNLLIFRLSVKIKQSLLQNHLPRSQQKLPQQSQ